MSTERDPNGPDGCAQTPPWIHESPESPPVFRVGDGASHGYGSDSYPYTIRRVSPSGHKVWASRDKPVKGVFVLQDVPEKDWICFTRRRDGHYREANQSYARQHALVKGRDFYLDPSF